MEDLSVAEPGGGNGAPPGATRGRNFRIGVVAALIVAIGAVYVWKEVSVGQVRTELTAERDSLHRRALLAIEERTAELLRLSAVPLGWAVRSGVQRRDLGAVEGFLDEFVQEPGVRAAVVAGPGDSILVATDSNLRGRPFSAHFPGELLRLSEPGVSGPEGPAGLYRVAVPILGPTRSLGVLVVEYVPEGALRLLPPSEEEEAPGGGPPAAEPSPDGDGG